MNKPITILLTISTILLVLTSCGEPRHLSWDYGRSYTEAFTLQTNLTRPSIIASEYQLSGLEAANIRLKVEEAVSDAADATPESI